MSEENQQTEVSIGFAHTGERVEIEFADGRFVISEETVALLGGTENLEKIAPALKGKTFAEFMAGVGTVRVKQELNRLQSKIISNHLAGGFSRF